QPLAEIRIGNPHGGGFSDVGVRQQHRLALPRIHLLSTGDDHVVDAAAHEEAAVLAAKPDVAGLDPGAWRHGGAALNAEPARLAVWQASVGAIADGDMHAPDLAA